MSQWTAPRICRGAFVAWPSTSQAPDKEAPALSGRLSGLLTSVTRCA